MNNKNFLLNAPDVWMITSDATKQPYLTGAGKAFIYTNKEKLANKLKTMEEAGDSASTILCSGDKAALCENLRDCGVSGIILDDDIVIEINEIVKEPAYDGYIDLEKPLLNSKLNFSLNLFYQELAKDQSCFSTAQLLFARLKDAFFLAPVDLKAGSSEQNMDPSQIIFPVTKDIYGNDCIPVFTDWRMFCDYMTQNNIEEGRFGGYLLNVPTMQAALLDQKGLLFVLNPNSVKMRLSEIMLSTLQQVLDKKSFDDNARRMGNDFFADSDRERTQNVPAEKKEEDDPTPDFLKSFYQKKES